MADPSTPTIRRWRVRIGIIRTWLWFIAGCDWSHMLCICLTDNSSWLHQKTVMSSESQKY